jgi:hypothetical protein
LIPEEKDCGNYFIMESYTCRDKCYYEIAVKALDAGVCDMLGGGGDVYNPENCRNEIQNLTGSV